MEDITKNKLLAIAAGAALIIALISTFPANEVPKSDKQVFTEIYDKNLWGWKGSGIGAMKQYSMPFIEYLQNFINSNNITSIVDIGCGDWEMMKYVNIPSNINYIGVDIVDKIIENNKKHYAKENISFEKIDNIKELSKYNGDLLIIKDVMQHWDTITIWYSIGHIISNFKYALIVNNIVSQGAPSINSEINAGNSRPLDLEVSPFFMKLRKIKDYTLPNRVKRIYLYVAEDQPIANTLKRK